MSIKTKKKSYDIVTGSAKRLGSMLSLFLAEQGYSLILHYHSSEKEMLALQKKLTKKNTHFFLIKQDFYSHTNNAEEFIKKCISFKKPIAGLINNASVFLEGNLQNGKNLLNQFKINVQTPLELIAKYQTFVGCGHIINILDARMHQHSKTFSNYRMSKKMLEIITLEAAKTLAPKIRVNAIAPGSVMPLPTETTASWQKRIKKDILSGKAEAKNVLECLDFLEKNAFLTGQILFAGNGVHLT